MNRLLKEPLLHFLVIGVMLFVSYGVLNPSGYSDDDTTITVSSGQIEHLATTFSKTWQRPPTMVELKGLIDEFVEEELLSREAVRIGLDQNDTVIRRRLKQKMEFVTADFAEALTPTEEELKRFLSENAERFTVEPSFTFKQVYLSDEQRGKKANDDAQKMLKRLGADESAEFSSLGDSGLLPSQVTSESVTRVNAVFGESFSLALAKAPVGEWSGPYPSSFGVHLVFLEDRVAAHLPELDEVRAAVMRDLLHMKRAEMKQSYLDSLLAKYEVDVEWPEGASEQADQVAMVGSK